jgi:hypothetical protein
MSAPVRPGSEKRTLAFDVGPAGDTSVPDVEDDQPADEVDGVLEDDPLLFG